MTTWIWTAEHNDQRRAVVAECPRFTQAQDACRKAVLDKLRIVDRTSAEHSVLLLLLDNIADTHPFPLADVPELYPPAVVIGGPGPLVEVRVTGHRPLMNR